MFNNKRHISAVNVRRITDHNEIFYHLAEVMVQQVGVDKGSLVSRVDDLSYTIL